MAQRSLVSTFFEGLFSLNGRISRGVFWICSIALGIVAFLLPLVLTRAIRIVEPDFPRLLLFGLTQLLIAWPAFAITVKRGHDRERSALWTLGVNIAGQVLPFVLLLNGQREGGLWVWVVIGVYALFEYGLLPGTAGPNKYGPSPTGAGQTNFIT